MAIEYLIQISEAFKPVSYSLWQSVHCWKMNDRESQLWKRCILVLYIIKKLEFFTLFSGEKEWNLKCFHLFREWKVKWECLEIEIENEKWNEKALKSRSRVKSEMKMPRDRDREVKFQNNSREFSRNETLAGYCLVLSGTTPPGLYCLHKLCPVQVGLLRVLFNQVHEFF